MNGEGYYKDRGEEKNWPKLILMILGGLILALIVFLLVKGCVLNNKNEDLERSLLEAGKEYYSSGVNLLPQAKGECSTVTLGTLVNKNLLSSEDYVTCNNDKTYVKVCKLESGNYHYVPVLQCGEAMADDNFTVWKDGFESDLVADKSDVRFTFKGEHQEGAVDDATKEEEAWLDELTGINYQTISSTQYYRYRDLMWKWQTTTKKYYSSDDKVYYASAPSGEYTNKEGTTTGWKWYTTVSNKVWEKEADPTVTKASLYRYICYDGEMKYSTTPCEAGYEQFRQGSGYYCVKGNFGAFTESCSSKGSDWKEYGRQYTCDGSKIVGEGTVCSITCPAGTLLNDDETECGNIVESTTKQYYPSKSSNASGEKNYYLTAPVNGAVKDSSTEIEVSRYYKTVTTTTSKYYSTSPSKGATKVGEGIWGSWTEYQLTQPKPYADTREIETRTKVVFKRVTNVNSNNWTVIVDDYLSEADLIAKYQSLGYQVNTLRDIETADNLRYQVKLQYRDRK